VCGKRYLSSAVSLATSTVVRLLPENSILHNHKYFTSYTGMPVAGLNKAGAAGLVILRPPDSESLPLAPHGKRGRARFEQGAEQLCYRTA
jgi:hypothetical protein